MVSDDIVICNTMVYSRDVGGKFDIVIPKKTLWQVPVYDFYGYTSCISTYYCKKSYMVNLFHRTYDDACDGTFKGVCDNQQDYHG